MKVTPKTKMHNEIDYADLEYGDAFFWRGDIWMKTNDEDQGTVNLNTGECQTSMCGELVVPTNATVTWKRKETKKKAKSPQPRSK